jgi:Bax protein
MQNRDKVFFAVVIVACIFAAMLLNRESVDEYGFAKLPIKANQSGGQALPDFTDFSDVKEKKQTFFEFMLPMVSQENQRIQALREQVLLLEKLYRDNGELADNQQQWLMRLAEHYKIDTEQEDVAMWLKILKLRVDTVPPSLALAQAANESAWGTSRFAVRGNNLFGQWCFRPGCGLVPDERPDGERYEVAKFKGPQQSVNSYIHNLNTNHAYRDLRKMRAQKRQAGEPVTGKFLAAGLTKYSTRGEEYIEELRSMIRVNKLTAFDKPTTKPATAERS